MKHTHLLLALLLAPAISAMAGVSSFSYQENTSTSDAPPTSDNFQKTTPEEAESTRPRFVAKIGSYYDFRSDLGGGLGTVEQYIYLIDTPIFGKRINKNWLYFSKLKYTATQFNFQDNPILDDLSLHAIQFRHTLIWQSDSKIWSGIASFSPSLNTDYNSVDFDAVNFNFFSAVSRRLTDTLTLGAGFLFSQQFGEPRFFPGLTFLWQPNDQFALELTGPSITAAYKPDDRWRIELATFFDGGSWQIENRGSKGDLNLSKIRSGLGIERALFGEKAYINLWGGVNWNQSLEYDSNDRAQNFEENIETSYFTYLGLRFRF